MKRILLATAIAALASAILLVSAPGARADIGHKPVPQVLRANIVGAGVSGTGSHLVAWQWAYTQGRRPTSVTVTQLRRENVNILWETVTLDGLTTHHAFPVYPAAPGWGSYSITFHAVWVEGPTVVHRWYTFYSAYIG